MGDDMSKLLLVDPFDPYERHRQDALLYRERRERGEPFTLWDFQVFAEMNSNDLTKDYQEEQDKDWTR